MNIKDINDIINAVCPNDEDYEKPCISPKYLRQELEQLALDQEQKYLEQGSSTKNNLGVDCIDRIKLLKTMDTWDKFGYTARYGLERLDKDDKGFVPYVKYDDMIKCVKGMPSVTPQPRKGHWIVQPSNKEQGERDFIWWKCSECGQVIFSETLHDRLKFHAFCGRCGADMR